MDWLHQISSALPAFLASLVEFVEALTIVLAVGTTRGWRSALLGTFAAILALAILLLLGGPSIAKLPLRPMQVVIGLVVAVFGFRWLKKATLRSAGRIPMHDEVAEYDKQVAKLGPSSQTGIDKVATLTTFKATFLEGFEVAFIVITAGSVSGNFSSSVLGASLALLLVVLLGVAVHRPLANVPENSLKKTVGVLLTAFGIFWFGEGCGLEWPGGDWTIAVLIAVLFALSWTASKILVPKSQP